MHEMRSGAHVFHPIAAEASLLIKADKGGIPTLSEMGKNELRVSLAELDDPSELKRALEALVAVATYLEHDRRSHQVVTAILDIAASLAPMLGDAMHAIVDEAALMMSGGANESIMLDQLAQAELRSSLASLRDKPSLKHAVASLIDFAQHLEERKGSARAAEALLNVASTASAALAMQVELAKPLDRTKPHPIVAEAALYVGHANDYALSLSSEATKALRESLNELDGAHDLRHALESLIDLAAHLEERYNAPNIADALLEIAADVAPMLSMGEDNVHPIVAEASLYLMLHHGGRPAFTAESKAELIETLRERADQPDLKRAVRSLVDLATHLCTLPEGAAAARDLLEIANTAVPSLTKQIDKCIASMHPVAAEAALLVGGSDGGGLFYTDEALAMVEGSVQELHGTPELVVAISALVDLAQHLEKDRDSRHAADALLDIAANSIPALTTVQGTLHPIVAEASLFARPGLEEEIYFGPQAIDELTTTLAELPAGPTLKRAVESLVDLGAYLERGRRSPIAAQQLLAVAATAAPRFKFPLDLGPGLEAPHPIAAEASLLVVRANGGMTFSKEALNQLSESLTDIAQKAQLVAALKSLVDLAAHLEKIGSMDAALALLDLTATFIPSLERPPEMLHAIAAEASLLLTEFDGKFVYTEDAVTELRGSLARLSGAELKHGLRSLVDLARHLEVDRKSATAASVLLMCAASSVSGVGSTTQLQQQ